MVDENTKSILKTLSDIRKECKRIADTLESQTQFMIRKEKTNGGERRDEDEPRGKISE